ncbi:MAG: glutamine-hydrolyzing GMP synthase [Brevinematia bacterium]
MKDGILILDFGSQYTQLIARRIRENGVYSEIYPFHLPPERIREIAPAGIVLSGGPSSVLSPQAPLISTELLELGIPVLGICYGMQLITKLSGGIVEKSTYREYGRSVMRILHSSPLFEGVRDESVVWMSHGDSVIKLPEGFEKIASSDDCEFVAAHNVKKKIFLVQFHPEVVHTEEGEKILRNFVFNICNSKPTWDMGNFLDEQIRLLRERCRGKKTVLGVSGGVDSTTLAVIAQKAIGNDVTAVFINNGLLRLNEEKEVLNNLQNRLNLKIDYIDASRIFLNRLKGVVSPEKKRKIIGETFIKVFYKGLKNFDYLIQGTLYPDVIESSSVKGPSSTIKTHHNRVKEILRMEREGRVIEPFKFLFKDEVRKIAKLLGIPDDILNRHPFPGPGLAVRIIGEVTTSRLNILRQADFIFIEELKAAGYYDKVWQAFCVFLPVKSVGVMGDERAYGNVIALRAITSVDGMTANWAELPYSLLDRVANRIIRQIKEVNRVVYDVTSKPPATIEWE